MTSAKTTFTKLRGSKAPPAKLGKMGSGHREARSSFPPGFRFCFGRIPGPSGRAVVDLPPLSFSASAGGVGRARSFLPVALARHAPHADAEKRISASALTRDCSSPCVSDFSIHISRTINANHSLKIKPLIFHFRTIIPTVGLRITAYMRLSKYTTSSNTKKACLYFIQTTLNTRRLPREPIPSPSASPSQTKSLVLADAIS